MFTVQRLMVAFCGIALLGGALLVQLFTASAALGEGVVARASGSGHFTSGGELRTFTFNAIRRADGTVSGEWEVISRAGAGARLHGDVLCLAINGNQAWIGTRIESATNPVVIIGSEGGFRVVDNGEGANEPPDAASLAFFNGAAGFAQNYCDAMAANPPLNPVEHGNLQVED
jgi:hypothetical protein